MVKRIFLLLICFNCLFALAQKDTCVTLTHKKNQIYLLTELNKISKDRLIGQLKKVIDLKEAQLIENFQLNNVTNKINLILEKYPELSTANYKVQIIPFLLDKKKYCQIIFQAELPDNICYNTLVFSQMDGGNSFCYFLFDLNAEEMIYSRCNDW